MFTARQSRDNRGSVRFLDGDGDPLEEEGGGTGFAGSSTDPSSELPDKVEALPRPRTESLHCDGHKEKSLEISPYFASFFRKAFSAAPPPAALVTSLLLLAMVSTQVKSHTRARPRAQGTKVIPSGLLPSERLTPGGSVTAGMTAEPKACRRSSLTER